MKDLCPGGAAHESPTAGPVASDGRTTCSRTIPSRWLNLCVRPCLHHCSARRSTAYLGVSLRRCARGYFQNMSNITLIIVIIVAVLIIAALVIVGSQMARRRRTETLR